MSNVKEVHFTLDESAGILIMNIAQEHLLYSYSPSKALESIKNILTGCPDELALAILNGDKVIYVETDEKTGHQSLMVDDRNEFNDTIFPKLAIDFFAKHNMEFLPSIDEDNILTVLIKMTKPVKTYTRAELDKHLLAVMNLGMGLRQSQLNGSDLRSGNVVLEEYKLNNL